VAEDGLKMKLLAKVLSLGCVASSIVIFPLVVIGGGAALFLAAAGTELSHSITRSRGDGLDRSSAREMAARICFGYRPRIASHFTR